MPAFRSYFRLDGAPVIFQEFVAFDPNRRSWLTGNRRLAASKCRERSKGVPQVRKHKRTRIG
jgi:hypothetical protein